MKKNMKKVTRITALIMAMLLCLSACGNQTTKESESSTKDSVSNSSQQELTPSTVVEEEKSYWELLDTVSDTSELPDWEGETLEIKIWHAGGTTQVIGDIADTDVVYKEIERVTGVKFNVEESFDNGGNNIDAKLPMVVASKDLPTIIMGYNIDKQFNELYDNGYLADLTEYYEDGSLDNLLAWFPQEEMATSVYSKCTASDGQLYLIPYNTASSTAANVFNATGYTPDGYDREYYATYGQTPVSATARNTDTAILVREDILQALYPDTLSAEEITQIYVENGSFTKEQIFDTGLKSSDDFWQFLRDVKDLVASGDYEDLNGNPVEVMAGPHTETDNWAWMTYLPNLVDGVPGGTDYFVTADRTAADEGDILQYAFSNDYYTDFMKDLNALVREDVISQNSLLDNAAAFQEKCKNAHYAVLYGSQYVPYYNEVEGYRPIWIDTPYNSDMGGFSTFEYQYYFGIFKNSVSDEQLDQLIHFVNYLNSEVGIKNFWWGPASAGLFTEDADGNRTYTVEELEKCMIYGEVNGADKKYGLIDSYATEPGFRLAPKGIGTYFYGPKYLVASELPREEKMATAFRYFNPGTLSGYTLGENATYVKNGCEAYGAIAQKVEGMAQFWAARAGFENQVKKVIVAGSEADFEKQYNELLVYTEENGLTEDALQEFNDLWLEPNRELLKDAGIID